MVLGKKDFVVVGPEGANIPARYRPLLDAFGLLTDRCSVTHIGEGLAITAGHCFFKDRREATRDLPCPASDTVAWGYRSAKAPYLRSTCTAIVAAEYTANRDYAIFRVDPAPPAKIAVDVATRPPPGTRLTLFGHPSGRPLEWSKTCALIEQVGSSLLHGCDTEGVSSGSAVLQDSALAIVGIHDGSDTTSNRGTYLVDTPLGEILGVPSRNAPPAVSFVTPVAGAYLRGRITVTADASDRDGTVTKVTFRFPDGTTADATAPPYTVTWDTAGVGTWEHVIHATARDDRGATGSAAIRVRVYE